MDCKIKELKEKLKYIGTKDLLELIGRQFITFANDGKSFTINSDIFQKTKLNSPMKQYAYLAGLLMTTDDKSNSLSKVNVNMYEIENSIQAITNEYMKGFFDIENIGDQSIVRKHLVSMEAFTSYFDTGILRYPEQTINLIHTLYEKFDQELEERIGLRTEDFLAFYQLVCEEFKASIERVREACEEQQRKLRHLDVNDTKILEQEFKNIMEFSGDFRTNLSYIMSEISTLKASIVISHFKKDKGQKLLEIFGLHRKEDDFCYYNGRNPFVEHPLCWLGDMEHLYIVHPQFVLNAVYSYITEMLENPTNVFLERYKRRKSKIVEEQFLKYFHEIFKDKAKYHANVCEERGTKEHDLLIEYHDCILIAEVKASKVREPCFNPKIAYKKIKDHFNSDSGVGGAYSQAILLKKFLERNNDAVLYENHNTKFNIKNIHKKKILPVVLTLNQFGGLAVNTSLILEKEENQPYPWVCNMHDFENIIEIIKFLGKKPKDFIDYITWRIKNHTKVLSADELDVIEGYFLNSELKRSIEYEPVIFQPNGPSLIDKIYFDKLGIPYAHPKIKSSRKTGRNDLCPCGSGKKFKKCCLGKGIYK